MHALHRVGSTTYSSSLIHRRTVFTTPRRGSLIYTVYHATSRLTYYTALRTPPRVVSLSSNKFSTYCNVLLAWRVLVLQEQKRHLRAREARQYVARLRELQALMTARVEREIAGAKARKSLKRYVGARVVRVFWCRRVL